MTTQNLVEAACGGILIGVAASSLLLLNGRIAGISGIIGGLLPPLRPDVSWRALFVAGLMAGGVCVATLVPDAFRGLASTPYAMLLPAGLLVGFGASVGNGCTSGHGVCGVSRLSPRSIVATLTFMLSGAATVFVVRHVARIAS